MTRECSRHHLPLVEEWTQLGKVTVLDIPRCVITLRPVRTWLICDCDEIVGCADCECGGVLWGEGDAGDALAAARALLAEKMEARRGRVGGPHYHAAARLNAMAEGLAG